MATKFNAHLFILNDGFGVHFKNKFLRPYREGIPAPDENTIFKRIAAFNCEWLIRPNGALSELASTIRLNMDTLQRHRHLVNLEELANMESTLREPIDIISKFDMKEKTADPSKTDLTNVMKFHGSGRQTHRAIL